MKIAKLAEGVDTRHLLWELQRNPQLWNRDTRRTAAPDSPHHGVDDIWARYAAPEDVGKDGPHDSVWYDCGSAAPAIRIACRQIMGLTHAVRLGGVLITRIRPGHSVKPHTDSGWHSSYYSKIALQVQSAPGQKFCFEGEELEPMPGDLYAFDNSHSHWVTNPTDQDRITLIACVRAEEGGW